MSEWRTLLCAVCRQPQMHDVEHGWYCTNEHCTGVDKD